MSVLFRPLDSLRQALAVFFKHDVALRRAVDGVHVVLEERSERDGKARVSSRAELAAQKEAQELALMRQQLAELLDEQPETRQTMRHLVFLEQALAKRGLRALHRLPLDVLQRALEQLEGLVINWSPVGLASLRSKVAVAIIDREHMGPEAEAEAYRTAAVIDSRPVALAAAEAARSDDDALAAAYAALGDLAPAVVETHGGLGSPSSRAVPREASRPPTRDTAPGLAIELRELQS
jgi:hypothetical protein